MVQTAFDASRAAYPRCVAKIHYEADGTISPARFIAALTDFSPSRPDLWPNLSLSQYKVHEVGPSWADVTEGTAVGGLGGVWARERYDWSTPGVVTLTLQESRSFKPGTVITYRITPGAAGGCHVSVDFQRIASDLRGRLVGIAVQLGGSRRFAADLEETLTRLAAMEPPAPTAAPPSEPFPPASGQIGW